MPAASCLADETDAKPNTIVLTPSTKTDSGGLTDNLLSGFQTLDRCLCPEVELSLWQSCRPQALCSLEMLGVQAGRGLDMRTISGRENRPMEYVTQARRYAYPAPNN